MLAKIKSLFGKRQTRACVFLDGDQGIPALLRAFEKYAKGSEAYFVRHCNEGSEPRDIRERTDFQKIYLNDFKPRKEATDKFIGMMLVEKIREGYEEFTVISGDTDFIDIFKMAVILFPEQTFKFRFIIPRGAKVKQKSGGVYTTEDISDMELEVIQA